MRASLAIALSFGVHAAVAASLMFPRGSTPALATPAPAVAGETFELPAPETAEVPLANASPSPDTAAASAPPEPGDAPARPTPPSHARPAPRPSHAGRPSAGRADPTPNTESTGSTGSAALYGAVGDRSATDLATAFTRGFPQAASADPVWRSAPLGSAGDAVVVLALDDSGHIESSHVTGAPPPALSNGIRRTLALIRGRPFVAKGKITKLHLSATITADAIHDGLHGEVFAIGGSFPGTEGSAFFALAIGRRIDVRIRLAK